MPETLEHLMVTCQHPAVLALRGQVRTKLDGILAQATAVAAEVAPICQALKDVPDLDDDGTLMTVLLCGTSHTSVPAAGALADSVGFDDMQARRRLEEISYQADTTMRVVKWVGALTSFHRSALSSSGPESEHKLSPVGKDLIDTVCDFSLRLSQKRRHLLAEPARGFELRQRDPAAARAAAAAARARPAVGADGGGAAVAAAAAAAPRVRGVRSLRHAGAGAAPAKSPSRGRRVAPCVAALARGLGRAQSAKSGTTTASRVARGAVRASLGGRPRRGAQS
jgi:hypothetical protein